MGVDGVCVCDLCPLGGWLCEAVLAHVGGGRGGGMLEGI